MSHHIWVFMVESSLKEFDLVLCVRFPRRTLVCTKSFWRTTEGKTRPRWIWRIKVNLEVTNWHKRIDTGANLSLSDDQICPLSRFQRLDEWSFQFYRWEDERLVHAINISVHESFLIWIILFQNWYLNSSQFLHPAEDHEHWWGRPTLHLRQLLQRFTPSDVALQVGPTPASQSVCSLFKSISYTHSSWRIHGSTWE